MNVTLTLNIDGVEIYRNFNTLDVEWDEKINDMADTILNEPTN